MRARAFCCGIAALAGCSFTGPAGAADAPIDGGSIISDGGADAAGMIAWSIRTQADFIDPGADPTAPPSFVTSLASSRDLIEPAAYQAGGLLGHASNLQLFTSADAAWDPAAWGADATSRSTIALPLGDYGGGPTGFPGGLGIDDGDSFTTWWEGEIYLEAGSHNLSVDADSSAFVEIDAPDGTVRAQDDTGGAGAVVAISIDTGLDGHYPIRIAHAEGTTTSRLNVLHQPPGTVAPGNLSHGRLRARASELTGAVRAGFDDLRLGDPGAVTRFEDTLVGETYGSGFPAEVGITDHDSWSQRLAGQAWIDVAGAYAMHVVCDAGYRVVLDGVLVSDPTRFDATDHDDMVPLGTLVRGWHDLALDHQDVTGNTDLSIELIDPALAADKIAAGELRPVSSGRERVATATSPKTPDPLPGQLFAAIDAGRFTELVELAVTYEIDHPAWDELEVTLTTPWAETVTLRDHVAQPGDGIHTVTVVVPAASIPPNPGNNTRPATGRWRLDVDDTENSDAGSLLRWSITARYTGGPAAIAPTAQYTSGVHDFGSPREVSGLTAAASTPVGSAAAIALRTCTALPCTGEFVPATAMTFPLPAAQYVQIQVTFTSNGIESPFVDDVGVYILP